MKIFIIAFCRLFLIPFILFFYLIMLYPLKKSYKKRLVKALERCGPVFIKLGQSISLKPYIFSKETIEACSNLQDKVSPPKINLQNEMGSFYKDFTFPSQKPIASGSIASVFEGFLGKEKVAVKILRKSAPNIIKADLFILKKVSKALQLIKIFKRLKLHSVVLNIEQSLLMEIDFRNEAQNLTKIKHQMLKIHPKASPI